MSTIGFHHLIQRLGKAARMPLPLHPHMLRHACGYKLANDGHDTRALQHYLGHKNIQHTVRYTELSPDGFRNFWREISVSQFALVFAGPHVRRRAQASHPIC
jgi:site-specific recombinase XerD